MVSEQLSASIRSLYGPGSEMGAGTWDNRGQIRWAVTQAQGGLVPAAECWSHGGINLFWTCFNFHQIHLTMAQRAAENVQWSNRKPGLCFCLILCYTIYVPLKWIVDVVRLSVEMSCCYQYQYISITLIFFFFKSSSPLSQAGQVTSRQLIVLQILSRVWREAEGSEAPTQAELTLTDTGLQRIGAAKFRKI